jgi:CheY-like chemotaxis protein
MSRKILWIEDDFYAIRGLIRPIEQQGIIVDVATSAFEGYIKASNWKNYDLIIADLILPISNNEDDKLPALVKSWEDKYEYIGLGIIKWLMEDLKIKRPLIICSVVRDPISTFSLGNLGIAGYISKSGLLPSMLKDEVFKVLEISG